MARSLKFEQLRNMATATDTKNLPARLRGQAQAGKTTAKTTAKKTVAKKAAPKPVRPSGGKVSMDVNVYDQNGKETGKVTLPEAVFGLPWNGDLVHQVVVSQQANARTPVAHTKDRSEVRGGGAKPWRQKGTGRARHGSRRSPIWVGGGVTFGPRKEKDYSKKINKKMRTKALYTVLSKKLKDGEILFVDTFAFGEPKRTEAKKVIGALGTVKGYESLITKKKNAALVALPSHEENTAKSFRNFGNVLVDEVRNLNPVTALTYKYLIITDPKNAISFLESKSDKK